MTNPFDKISKANISKLLRLLEAHTIIFNKDSIISKSFIDKRTIGIITQGYVQIIKNSYDGNDTLVEELFENDIIASSISYVDSNEYQIISKEDTSIILFDEDILINMEDISKTYFNQFVKNLFLILSEKNKIKNERIQIITKKSIRDKLLEYFAINRKRSALMRELKNLKDEGFIETKGRRIKLLY